MEGEDADIIRLSNREQVDLLWALRKVLARKSLSKDRKESLTQIMMKFTVARHKVLRIKFQELR